MIPCNNFSDNHASEAKLGEFPLLTTEHKECTFCSPRWEYRADRAAVPLSALCCENRAAGVFIQPYADDAVCSNDRGYLRNGIFAELPDAFGVSLGYTNDPVTVKNRSVPEPSLRDTGRKPWQRAFFTWKVPKKRQRTPGTAPDCAESL